MRFLIIPFLLVFATAASAQGSNQACTRDASRFCRAKLNDGDFVVLACLQQHRAKLSAACAKVLTDNGR